MGPPPDDESRAEEEPLRLQAAIERAERFQKPMSKRTPQWAAFMNLADRIEHDMIDNSHRTWGWVVYRCTYEDDEEWGVWKERFIAQTRKSLEEYNGLDLLDSLKITFVEDREKFNNATAATIREYFSNWVSENALREQDGAPPLKSARYNFCLQADLTSLRSNLDGNGTDEGSIVIIWREWESWPEMDDDSLDPIDGCIQKDVGWGRFAFEGFSATWYNGLRNEIGWEVLSERPPEVAEG